MEGEISTMQKDDPLLADKSPANNSFPISLSEQLSALYDESDEDEEPVDNTQD